MHFFFYGTLMAESGNPVARRLHTLLGPGLAATTPGTLYAIEDPLGWYPGMVPDPLGRPVYGFLHETTGRFGAEDLEALDQYEHFDPLAPDRSEFIRREIVVESASQSLAAQAYVLRVPPVRKIVTVADGSFSSFARQRCLPVYGCRQ